MSHRLQRRQSSVAPEGTAEQECAPAAYTAGLVRKYYSWTATFDMKGRDSGTHFRMQYNLTPSNIARFGGKIGAVDSAGVSI